MFSMFCFFFHNIHIYLNNVVNSKNVFLFCELVFLARFVLGLNLNKSISLSLSSIYLTDAVVKY